MAKFDESKHGKQSPIRKTKSNKRTLTKSSVKMPDNYFRGTVNTIVGKIALVEYVDSNSALQIVECVTGGTLVTKHLSSTLITTGDCVKFIIDRHDSEGGRTQGVVFEIEPRTTKLSRIDPSNSNREHVIAANIDNLIVYMSAFDPEIKPGLIDRLIISAQLGKVNPIICINKMDLADLSQFKDYFDLYEDLGIPIHYISAREQTGTAELLEQIIGKETVVIGQSGAGKSTFLNLAVGEDYQRVAVVSDSSGKGKHTTTFARRFALPQGGHLIDTPGIREFGIWDLHQDELALFFPDFEEYYLDCKFLPCTHTHEPHCAVKAAVDGGKILSERYNSYLSIMDSLDK